MNKGWAERRVYARSKISLLVTARGVDAKGARFECAALLHNIGEGGVLIRVTRRVGSGSEMQVHLSLPPNPGKSAGKQVSASGRVLRVRPQPLDTCDVAIQFAQPLTELRQPSERVEINAAGRRDGTG
jgi:hypothetical protein